MSKVCKIMTAQSNFFACLSFTTSESAELSTDSFRSELFKTQIMIPQHQEQEQRTKANFGG